MSWPSFLQYGVFLLVIIALVKPLGGYMARVFAGQKTWPDVVLRPIERVIYKLTRVDAAREMNWKEYALSFIILGLVGTIVTYLILRLLGEIVFGGLGTGLYSIIFVALVGLFLAGLMIGRTPEYLGKTIGITQIKFIMLYTLASPLAVLLLTAIAVATQPGLAGLTTNDGPHGLTSIMFAYTSSFANNGQNFAGLSANSVFYNVTTAIAMMVGRFGLAVPALALAGSFAAQGRRPTTLGTMPTYTFTFGLLVVGTALIVGGLSYFPAVVLGPVTEHLLMK
jgi:potassium-transporting ATPase potassium-binding subunit